MGLFFDNGPNDDDDLLEDLILWDILFEDDDDF